MLCSSSSEKSGCFTSFLVIIAFEFTHLTFSASKETALKRHLYATDPEYKAKVKEVRYRSKYGIDFQRYDEILEIQDGVCAICKGKDFGRKGLKKFLVDHCHATDKVRGLVCNNCNSLIGFSREDTTIIQNAIEYLNDFELGADNLSQ